MLPRQTVNNGDNRMVKMSKLRYLLMFILLAAAPALANVQLLSQNGHLVYFDSSTGETVDALAPVKLTEEFAGFSGVITAATEKFTFAAVNSGTWVQLAGETGGLARVTTGTADNDDAEVASELIWSPGKYCAMEARVRINTPTAAFNVGFSDATGEAADTLAVTFATATLTSNASDCALFFADYDATSNLIRCVAVDSDSDGTVTSTGTTFAEDTWYVFKVEIDADGDCGFWFNGDLVYTETTGISTDVDLTAYLGLIAREGSAQSMDIDYIRVWQKR